MGEDPFAAVPAIVERVLGPSSRWNVTVERSQGPTIVCQHPASVGVTFDVRDVAADIALRHLESLLSDPEFGIADAAPPMTHPDIVMGARALAAAFEWPNVEVRAVAYLLFEAGAISSAEAGWLAGYLGAGAPMRATRPDP